jgi:hypothetical protein
MSLAAGTRLGQYEILAPLGAGGMGEVYRARDTRLDREVAVKVLPESLAGDPDRRARFEREAKAVAALSHPNILAIFDFGEHPTSSGQAVFYAATELLQGETLRDRLKSGPLPSRKAGELGVQIARGLSAAHDRGIVHRDLKPENLFLVGDGQIKILDFGLARQATSSSGSGATQTIAATDPGTVMGTIGYMAPEQVRGLAVDARADLFSLGAVLYEMVTGQRAFQRDTAADTMSAILREDPPEFAGTRADLSPALDRIIRHCLEKDPNERFQTARDVAFALSSLTGSATASSISGASVAIPAPARRANWWLPVAVAIVAAAGGVALGRTMVPPVTEVTFTQKTMVAQAIFNARFMPDGKTMVFSSAMTGNSPSLYESRADSAAQRAFGPPGTHLLSIARTGELAVLTGARFLGHRLMSGTLARMNVDGAPRAIGENVREADWLPDGSDLVVIRSGGGRDQLEFPIGHVVLQTIGYFSDPRVSPDGTRVAFMEHPVKYDNRGWVKVVDRAGAVTTIGGEFNGEEGVAWSPDGRHVLFSGSDAAEYRVYSAPAAGGKTPVAILSSASSLYIHDIAADGRVAATREDTRYAVIARGAGQDAERELTPFDQAWLPTLSEDGRIALFTDGRGGLDYAVNLRNVDGSPPVRLGDGNAGNLSRDGRWATANLFSTGRCVVYSTGAAPMVPVELGPLERCTGARFFPDGKSLLIEGNEPGKPNRVYRASFPGGTPQPLLPEGITPRVISDSGRSVLANDASGAWLRFEIGGGSAPVKGLGPGDDIIEWSADERSAVTGNGRTIPAQVFRVQLDTGARIPLGEVAPQDRAGVLGLTVHAYRENGRQYVYAFTKRVSALYLITR